LRVATGHLRIAQRPAVRGGVAPSKLERIAKEKNAGPLEAVSVEGTSRHD
jgi:hypothetical protein